MPLLHIQVENGMEISALFWLNYQEERTYFICIK
jgi:hypothetical protein